MTVKVTQLKNRTGWYLAITYKGKRIYRRVADDKETAKEIAKDVIKELEFRGYGALERFKPKGKPHGMTVSKYADKWIAEIKKSGLKPATIDSYESNIEIHIKPHFGNLPLADVNYARVKEFIRIKLEGKYAYGSEKQEARPTRAYSRDSIRIMVATLRSMFREAVRDEIIKSNPIRDVGRFYSAASKRRDIPDPLGLSDLHDIEKNMEGTYHPLLMFQSRTGCRVGEAIALQWKDIDLDKQTALIRRNMPSGRKGRETGKPKSTSSTRTVQLTSTLIGVLQDHQKAQREYWFAKGEDMPEWVFPTKHGTTHLYGNFRRAFIRTMRKLKIRERRVHDLRHTWASQQLAAGKPITWVSGQLGHKNPQITLSIYARWIPGESAGNDDVMDGMSKKGDSEKSRTK